MQAVKYYTLNIETLVTIGTQCKINKLYVPTKLKHRAIHYSPYHIHGYICTVIQFHISPLSADVWVVNFAVYAFEAFLCHFFRSPIEEKKILRSKGKKKILCVFARKKIGKRKNFLLKNVIIFYYF